MQTRQINEHFLHGYETIGPGALSAEYVRCYAGEWTVFYRRNGNILVTGARTRPRYTYNEARAEARRFVKEGTIDGRSHFDFAEAGTN